MFKSLTKDLAGTADICVTVSDPSRLAVGPYLLAGEAVVFAFQSAKEEFAFTNEALIRLEGENATTTRKLVQRFDYRDHAITRVQFETTGRIDLDCEIKFCIGREEISIDIARKEENAVKTYYKALVALGREQEERQRRWQFAQDGLDDAARAFKLKGLGLSSDDAGTSATASSSSLTGHASELFSYLDADYHKLNSRCYREVLVQTIAAAQ